MCILGENEQVKENSFAFSYIAVWKMYVKKLEIYKPLSLFHVHKATKKEAFF